MHTCNYVTHAVRCYARRGLASVSVSSEPSTSLTNKRPSFYFEYRRRRGQVTSTARESKFSLQAFRFDLLSGRSIDSLASFPANDQGLGCRVVVAVSKEEVRGRLGSLREKASGISNGTGSLLLHESAFLSNSSPRHSIPVEIKKQEVAPPPLHSDCHWHSVLSEPESEKLLQKKPPPVQMIDALQYSRGLRKVWPCEWVDACNKRAPWGEKS